MEKLLQVWSLQYINQFILFVRSVGNNILSFFFFFNSGRIVLIFIIRLFLQRIFRFAVGSLTDSINTKQVQELRFSLIGLLTVMTLRCTFHTIARCLHRCSSGATSALSSRLLPSDVLWGLGICAINYASDFKITSQLFVYVNNFM